MDRTFMSKENRDRAWGLIPKESRSLYRKASMRGQLLHPMYVNDYEQVTGIKLGSSDKGFGNTIYRTLFPVLYEIRKRS